MKIKIEQGGDGFPVYSKPYSNVEHEIMLLRQELKFCKKWIRDISRAYLERREYVYSDHLDVDHTQDNS